MSYQKLQTRQALSIIPSDVVEIPDPSTQVLTGQADFATPGTLTDVGTTFLSDGIQQGAIIYNITDKVAYYVLDVTDDLNLSITSIAGGSGAADYVIYNAATIGCTLFVGNTGDVNVKMAVDKGSLPVSTGEQMLYKNLANGTFMPIQVVQVLATSTSATDILGQW
tara:strand:+ start:111 stop:608 length:498 start_codon:yes stop_codon:yes gene_type:complete